jgi:hypothetical protein
MWQWHGSFETPTGARHGSMSRSPRAALQVPRIGWQVDGRRVSSVARAHRQALARWPRWLAEENRGQLGTAAAVAVGV